MKHDYQRNQVPPLCKICEIHCTKISCLYVGIFIYCTHNCFHTAEDSVITLSCHFTYRGYAYNMKPTMLTGPCSYWRTKFGRRENPTTNLLTRYKLCCLLILVIFLFCTFYLLQWNWMQYEPWIRSRFVLPHSWLNLMANILHTAFYTRSCEQRWFWFRFNWGVFLMVHSTTICELVDLIPSLHQSDCRIPNWVSDKTVLSSSTNHGQTTARFRSFFR